MIPNVLFGNFEWDFEKSVTNQIKHGIGFEEASLVFQDPFCIIDEDFRHSLAENRWLCFGKVRGDVLTVRFTWRDLKIRILGAGFWRKGKRYYEKENQKEQSG